MLGCVKTYVTLGGMNINKSQLLKEFTVEFHGFSIDIFLCHPTVLLAPGHFHSTQVGFNLYQISEKQGPGIPV